MKYLKNTFILFFIAILLKENYTFATPFFFSWNNEEYIQDTIFLKNIKGAKVERSGISKVSHLSLDTDPIKGKIVIVNPETVFINKISLLVVDKNSKYSKQVELNPINIYSYSDISSQELDKILKVDKEYLILRHEDEVFIEFEKLPDFTKNWNKQAYIKAQGFYEEYPDQLIQYEKLRKANNLPDKIILPKPDQYNKYLYY
ncbi:hypothetical protein KAZ01_01230 [Candidatus Gracilibacteria bacterium]|nr:hypothetical protein [Candidatus Gracilibacteria bacterium]